MILGLSKTLSGSLLLGLRAHGVTAATAATVAHLPPISVLFAAFLGYNPLAHLLGPHVLGALPAGVAHQLTARPYFPALISPAFRAGLHEAFTFAMLCCLVAAAASWSRGGRYIHGLDEGTTELRPAKRSVLGAPSRSPAGNGSVGGG